MKQNLSLPVIIGVAVALIALLVYFGFRATNRENEGVDLDLAHKRQMEQHQRMTQPGASAQDKANSYGGGAR